MRILVPLLVASLGCTPPITETTAGPPISLAFPLPQRDRVSAPPFIGVDHDPAEQADTVAGRATCTNHDGEPFPHCYDGHGGTDLLLVGGFDAMDAQDMPVVAAADGEVIAIEQDQYDRCRLINFEVSCDGRPLRANYVIIEHVDGITTNYWHLRTDSVLVTVGQKVRCGDPIGLVGSSGNSSLPHLHFQVEDADEQRIDPFAGPFSQETSWWTLQQSDDGLPSADCATP